MKRVRPIAFLTNEKSIEQNLKKELRKLTKIRVEASPISNYIIEKEDKTYRVDLINANYFPNGYYLSNQIKVTKDNIKKV